MNITILNFFRISHLVLRVCPTIPFFLYNSFIPCTLRCNRSTFVESPLQIHLFMQNEPNFQKPKINLTHYSINDYKQKHLSRCRKNKPKQTQTNPIQTHFTNYKLLSGMKLLVDVSESLVVDVSVNLSGRDIDMA